MLKPEGLRFYTKINGKIYQARKIDGKPVYWGCEDTDSSGKPIPKQSGGGSSLFELDSYGDVQFGEGIVELMEADANGDIQLKE